MTTYIPSLTFPDAIFRNPAAAILLPVASGLAVGFLTSPKVTQNTYLKLKQPPFNPPAYVFGPAWTILYAIMGYASYRAYTAGLSSVNPATIAHARHGATLYSIHLGLNLIWTPLYFVLKRPIEATIDILALAGTVAYMTYVWSKVDAVAAWAMAPYLGWLAYATYLCAGSGYLNGWRFDDKITKGSASHGRSGTQLINEAKED